MSNHLIEVFDDHWVDPDMVVGIRPYSDSSDYREVQIFLHGGKALGREFETDEELSSFITNLANLINGIRGLPKS